MAPKYEEFVTPNNPKIMDSIEVFTDFTNPERIEHVAEMSERQRMFEEIHVLSSEIYNARNSLIEKRLEEYRSDKLKRLAHAIMSGNLSFGGQGIVAFKDNTTRNLMDQETTISSMIYKKSDLKGLEGRHTAFVSHDRADEIFWYVEPYSPDADPITARYIMRDGEIYRSIENSPFLSIDDQELSNLHSSMKMIHYIASCGLYKDSLRSDFGLAA